jgi:hypothetical protein
MQDVPWDVNNSTTTGRGWAIATAAQHSMAVRARYWRNERVIGNRPAALPPGADWVNQPDIAPRKLKFKEAEPCQSRFVKARLRMQRAGACLAYCGRVEDWRASRE